MSYILYFTIAIISTTIGALTGVGGGVIMKPLLDILGHYDTLTISTLSAFTVFSMATASIIKQLIAKTKIDLSIVVPLALGSILGGVVGQKLLAYLTSIIENKAYIIVIQNSTLAILIIIILLYTINRAKIKSLHLQGIWLSSGVGMMLGIISSFLAIGGGPINVIAFVYLFSYDLKKATQSSIITIFFAQIANIVSIQSLYGFGSQDLAIMPFMIIGAISGGLIGSKFTSILSENAVVKAFNILQIVVFTICLLNILKVLLNF